METYEELKLKHYKALKLIKELRHFIDDVQPSDMPGIDWLAYLKSTADAMLVKPPSHTKQ